MAIWFPMATFSHNQTKGRILLLPVEGKGKVKPAGRVVEDFSASSGTK